MSGAAVKVTSILKSCFVPARYHARNFGDVVIFRPPSQTGKLLSQHPTQMKFNKRSESQLAELDQSEMFFRQLFHSDTFTYTYLLACAKTKEAVLIDPVDGTVERDLKYVEQLGLKLIYGINTHVHADHVTGTGKLKAALPEFKSVISAKSGADADKVIEHGKIIKFGTEYLECRETPGHTAGCMTYVSHDHRLAFTGDALLIRACGRTDFQQGNPSQLYDSVHKQIFSLPADYKLYPGHDYSGFTRTTVAEEKQLNPRLTLSKEKFITFMRELNLAYPRLIDVSVPANMKCGQYSKEAVDGSQKILDKIH